MNGTRLCAAAMLVLALAGCATTGGEAPARKSDVVGGAISQPFQDLGMLRQSIPEVLAKASASPYAIDEPVDCASVALEIASLDTALGPDLDAAAAHGNGAVTELALGALRGALELPFRGVVRRISGAEHRDRARVAAVLAGMVRRGYLKGILRGTRCAGDAG